MRFDDLVENMTVADMASGTATDGQVPAADGSGGIAWENLTVDAMDSGTATDGQVPTSDGSGGIAWEDQVGGSFDLHDDVTSNVGTALHLDDRMLVSDESMGGDPNRYAEVRDVAEKLHDLVLSRGVTTVLENSDLIPVADVSRSTGSKVRGVRSMTFSET